MGDQLEISRGNAVEGITLIAGDITAITQGDNPPSISFENNQLIYNDKAYKPLIPIGEVAPGSLIITFNNDTEKKVGVNSIDALSQYNVELTDNFSSLPIIVVKVPDEYTGHWAAALGDILPFDPQVNFNGINHTTGGARNEAQDS